MEFVTTKTVMVEQPTTISTVPQKPVDQATEASGFHGAIWWKQLSGSCYDCISTNCRDESQGHTALPHSWNELNEKSVPVFFAAT